MGLKSLSVGHVGTFATTSPVPPPWGPPAQQITLSIN
jgi:hypothetical protein